MSYAFSEEMLEVLGAWDTKAKNTNWRNQRRDRRGRWSNDPLMGAAEVGVLRDLGINAQAVGGAVRDQLMGADPKDIDFVVPNMSAEELKSSLEEHGRVEDLVVADRLVGARFYPASGAHPEGIEVVPTRREISTGEGHQDFDIVPDSSMTLEEDMERRDFTINAMARDVETGELTDPFGGEQDLQDGVLRTVSPTSFRDDPLRIIRGLRFVSKYGLEPDPDTFQQMKDNAPGVLNVSGERIRMELDKLLMGAQPAKALELARDTGVLQYMLPEVAATIGFDQESKYHDLTLDEHIFSVVQAAADQDTPLAVRLATLFHDVGKPDSAWRGPEGRLHYYANEEHGKRSHEDGGADMARVALNRMAYSNEVKDRVVKLVQSHMFQPKTRSIQARKFIAEHGRDVAVQLLAHRRADFSGKGEGELNSDSLESMKKFEELVQEEMGQPLFISELEIDGSDITKMGLKPGPEVGNILKSLLGDVIGSPDLNNREWLLNRAGSLVRKATNSTTQGKNTNWRPSHEIEEVAVGAVIKSHGSGDWSADLLEDYTPVDSGDSRWLASDEVSDEYEFSPEVVDLLNLEGKSPAIVADFKAIKPDNWRTQLRDARGRWVEQWSDSLPTDEFGSSPVLPPTPPPEDPVANSKTRFTVSPHGDGYAIFDNGEFHSIPESGTWGAAKKIANRLNDDQRTVKMKYQPQLAKDGGTTFHHGPDWIVQRKWDGVRAIFEVTEDETKVFSRTGQDLRPQFPEFNNLHEKYPPGIYDGEILALDENGQDDLERIQLRINDKKARKVDEIPVTVKFFDILEEDGESTQDLMAEVRLSRLEDAVGKENMVENLPADFKVEDIPKSWEGTMSKLRASKYEVGKRRSTWMKYKLKKSATLKVTGLTEGLGSRKASFGAVLVSDANGVPRGQIGSGFTQEDIDTLLRAQETGDWPLIEVEYRFLSKTGLLTNTAYKGIRHDKDEADRFDGTDGGEATPEEGVAVTVTEGTPTPAKASTKDPTAKIRWWREELATATLADDPDRIAKAEAKLSGLRKFAIANGFDPQNSAFELPEDDLPVGAMKWSRPEKMPGGMTIHRSGAYHIESWKDGTAYNTPTTAELYLDGKLVGKFLSVSKAKGAAERHSELPEGSMSDTEFRDYQDHLRSMDIGELENEDYTLRNERHTLDKMSDQEVEDRLGAVESEFIRRTSERLAIRGSIIRDGQSTNIQKDMYEQDLSMADLRTSEGARATLQALGWTPAEIDAAANGHAGMTIAEADVARNGPDGDGEAKLEALDSLAQEFDKFAADVPEASYEALVAYLDDGWAVTGALRTGDIEGDVYLAASDESRPMSKVIEDLDRAMKPLDNVIQVFRGLNGSFEDIFGKKPVVGAIVDDPAFMSTTLDRKVADHFAENGTLLEIEAPAGTPASLPYSILGVDISESELLLGRGANLEVMEVVSPNHVRVRVQYTDPAKSIGPTSGPKSSAGSKFNITSDANEQDRAAIARGFAAIDAVGGLPDHMPRIDLEITAAGNSGHSVKTTLTPTADGTSTTRTESIDLGTGAGPDVVVHEVGHFIESRMTNAERTAKNAILKDLPKAGFSKYDKRQDELWARAYEQWVYTRSDSDDLRALADAPRDTFRLDTVDGQSVTVPMVDERSNLWSDEDFAKVLGRMDALLGVPEGISKSDPLIGFQLKRGGFTWEVVGVDGDRITVENVDHGFTREWTREDLKPPEVDHGPVDDVDDDGNPIPAKPAANAGPATATIRDTTTNRMASRIEPGMMVKWGGHWLPVTRVSRTSEGMMVTHSDEDGYSIIPPEKIVPVKIAAALFDNSDAGTRKYKLSPAARALYANGGSEGEDRSLRDRIRANATLELTSDEALQLADSLDALAGAVEWDRAGGGVSQAAALRKNAVDLRSLHGDPEVALPNRKWQTGAELTPAQKDAYNRGWSAGAAPSSAKVEAADDRGAHPYWYLGFNDREAGNEKFASVPTEDPIAQANKPASKLSSEDLITIWNAPDTVGIQRHRSVGNELVARELLTVESFYRLEKISSKPGPEDPVGDRIAYAIDKDPSLADSYEELAWRLYDEDEAKFPGEWDITSGGRGQEMGLSEYNAAVLDWLAKNHYNKKSGPSELEVQLANPDSGSFLNMHMPDTFSGWKLHINVGGDPEREAAAYELLRPLVEDEGMGLKLATAKVQDLWADRAPQQLGKDITIYLPRRGEAQAHAQQIIETIGNLTYDGDIQNDQMLAAGIGLRFEFDHDPERDISTGEYHKFYASAGQSPDLPLPNPSPIAPALPDQIAWWDNELKEAELADNELFRLEASDEEIRASGARIKKAQAKLSALRTKQGNQTQAKAQAEVINSGYYEDLYYWPPEADKYFDSTHKSILKGHLIFRQGETFTHPQVVGHLNDLAKVPPESLVKAFTGPRGVEKIYVGVGGLPEHDELQDHRGVRPRGWPKGSSWNNVRGGYDRYKRQVIAGTGKGGSASVVLHELAHGMGDATGLDSSAELKAHQSRLFGTLNPYYRQGGKGSPAGMQELFAEGYAETVVDRQAAVEEFDEEFVAWIEKVTGLKGAELPNVGAASSLPDSRRTLDEDYGIRAFPRRQEAALKEYSTSSKYLNGILRRDGTPMTADKRSSSLADIRSIDSAMEPLKHGVVVERGIGDWKATFGPGVKIGKSEGLIWRDNGFVSTTVDARQAKKFRDYWAEENINSKGAILRLHLPSGTSAVYMRGATYTDEGELLLDRGYSYRVTAYRWDAVRRAHVVDAEVVPGSQIKSEVV